MFTTLRILLFLLAFVATGNSGFAQSGIPKKGLSPEDYAQWSALRAVLLSENGQFGAWHLHFETADTIRLQHLYTRQQFVLSGCTRGEFIGERYFVARAAADKLVLLDLHTGTLDSLKRVREYTVLDKENILLQTATDSLTFYNMHTGRKRAFTNVSAFAHSVTNAMIAVTCHKDASELYLVTSDGRVQQTLRLPPMVRCNTIHWQGNGQAFALTGSIAGKENYIGFYSCKEAKLYSEMTTGVPGIGKDATIAVGSFTPLSVSADGKAVFFGLAVPPHLEQGQRVFRLYNTHDKLFGINRGELAAITSGKPRIYCWLPHKGAIRAVGDPNHTEVFFNGSYTHAVTSEPFAYDPQWEQHSPRDYYVENRTGANRSLLLEKFPTIPNFLSASPYGQYLIYFKEGHWWSYNIVSGQHINITGNLPYPVYRGDSQYPGEKAMFEKPAWTPGDESILVCDAFDIWEISPEGKVIRQLTHGRGTGIAYRLAPVTATQRGAANHSGSLFGGCFDLKGRLLLRSYSEKGDGLSLLEGGKAIEIAAPERHIAMFTMDPGGKSILYSSEDYDLPPQVVHFGSGGTLQLLYQANSQHFKFKWGHSQLVTYSNSKGEKLQGALFYPANYDPAKKFPMVVSIYEKRAPEYRYYVNPGMQNPTGFNISNFTSRGYFVLLPDIVYETGHPGPSALDCVEAAVAQAIRKAGIDKDKLALVGHSFGGYEAAYIATHSTTFKTAVAGAPVTDLLAGYLYAGGYSGVPDYWRYEAGQMRMGATIFDEREAYVKNSPLFAARELECPLLLWVGSGDRQVDTSNAVKMHLALRRLQKESSLLEYQNEGHILLDPNNQRHLTASIEGWIDHYLLDEELPSWFTE